jgi:hypothetical protein
MVRVASQTPLTLIDGAPLGNAGRVVPVPSGGRMIDGAPCHPGGTRPGGRPPRHRAAWRYTAMGTDAPSPLRAAAACSRESLEEMISADRIAARTARPAPTRNARE